MWCYDISVGIATCHMLDRQVTTSRWRRDFPHTSRRALGPTQMGTVNFSGGKGGVNSQDVAMTIHPDLA